MAAAARSALRASSADTLSEATGNTRGSLFGVRQEGIKVEKKFDIATYIESVGRKLVSEFEVARKLGADPNAKGAGIESAARRQLESLLPSVLGVGQGYVIDSCGNTSRQIDLVVYEKNLCPVFSINDSPESTYYPCEGVVAAIEIKSQTSKSEFLDACEKATSVRQLRRWSGVELDGKSIAIRRYGQVEMPLNKGVSREHDPTENPRFYILTGLLTGKLNVSRDTLLSYYREVGRDAPDILISLDGVCVAFSQTFLGEENIVSNAKLAQGCALLEYERPFSYFVEILYMWLVTGLTAPLYSFGEYFKRNNSTNENPTT